MRRRAFTLVELVLVVALTAIIVGALAALYAFAVERAAHSAARYNVQAELTSAADRIQDTIQNAVDCSVVAAGPATGLKCVMPANGVDRDGDGYLDSYTPASVTRHGIERYGLGKRVWFYDSNSTASFVAPGTVVWRAERADDSLPTHPDCDIPFTFYFGGTQLRYPMISGFVFNVNAVAKSVTFTLSTSQLTRAERKASGGDSSAQSYDGSLTRTVYWRNWRP